MAANYVLSCEAGRDLEEIEDFTAKRWGDRQAEKYLRDIFRAFDCLAKNPDLGRSRSDVPCPYLVYAVGSHLIVYRHNQLVDRVEVLNVLHPAMDIKRRMKEALLRQNSRSKIALNKTHAKRHLGTPKDLVTHIAEDFDAPLDDSVG